MTGQRARIGDVVRRGRGNVDWQVVNAYPSTSVGVDNWHFELRSMTGRTAHVWPQDAHLVVVVRRLDELLGFAA